MVDTSKVVEVRVRGMEEKREKREKREKPTETTTTTTVISKEDEMI